MRRSVRKSRYETGNRAVRTQRLRNTNVNKHVAICPPRLEGSKDLALVEGSASSSGVGGETTNNVGALTLREESARKQWVRPANGRGRR